MEVLDILSDLNYELRQLCKQASEIERNLHTYNGLMSDDVTQEVQYDIGWLLKDLQAFEADFSDFSYELEQYIGLIDDE